MDRKFLSAAMTLVVVMSTWTVMGVLEAPPAMASHSAYTGCFTAGYPDPPVPDCTTGAIIHWFHQSTPLTNAGVHPADCIDTNRPAWLPIYQARVTNHDSSSYSWVQSLGLITTVGCPTGGAAQCNALPDSGVITTCTGNISLWPDMGSHPTFLGVFEAVWVIGGGQAHFRTARIRLMDDRVPSNLRTNVLSHEVGHSYGLGHTTDTSSTMYSFSPGNAPQPSFHDMQQIDYMYLGHND